MGDEARAVSASGQVVAIGRLFLLTSKLFRVENTPDASKAVAQAGGSRASSDAGPAKRQLHCFRLAAGRPTRGGLTGWQGSAGSISTRGRVKLG